MEYDRSDSYAFDFEPNGILFGIHLRGKLPPQSCFIQFEKKNVKEKILNSGKL